MFTGLVQAVGTVIEAGRRLEISGELPRPTRIGDSIAVNGCCLTAAADSLTFDLSDETLARTNLGALQEGSRVNLESSLAVGDAIGGHFVLGHVDGVGELSKVDGEIYTFAAPMGAEVFLAQKGSVAVDGVSLTVVNPRSHTFDVHVVEHTLRATTLGAIKPRAKVNIEFDVLARYVVRALQASSE